MMWKIIQIEEGPVIHFCFTDQRFAVGLVLGRFRLLTNVYYGIHSSNRLSDSCNSFCVLGSSSAVFFRTTFEFLPPFPPPRQKQFSYSNILICEMLLLLASMDEFCPEIEVNSWQEKKTLGRVLSLKSGIGSKICYWPVNKGQDTNRSYPNENWACPPPLPPVYSWWGGQWFQSHSFSWTNSSWTFPRQDMGIYQKHPTTISS